LAQGNLIADELDTGRNPAHKDEKCPKPLDPSGSEGSSEACTEGKIGCQHVHPGVQHPGQVAYDFRIDRIKLIQPVLIAAQWGRQTEHPKDAIQTYSTEKPEYEAIGSPPLEC
jgi:hypothetical protein